MSLNLNPEVEQLVQERVASGRFRSADEVVEEGLRLLDELEDIKSITDEELKAADCVVVVTNHSQIDYRRVTELAALVVDTRNALNGDLRRGSRARIIRL